MRQFMNHGERPRWPRVLIVDNDERRGRIGNGEAPKNIDGGFKRHYRK
jgi:hypothetical protein